LATHGYRDVVRRLLLSLATMWVGLVTLAGVVTLIFGSFFSFLEFILGWIAATALGVVMSAPFFVSAPPNPSLGTVKLWVPGLQFPYIAWIFKTLSWTGWYVLRGVWWLIHRGRDQQSARPLP
jgi:hypothetical protein